MRIILLILALSLPLAAQRVSGSNVVGSVANAQKLGGKSACSDTITTNCHKALDASGNLAINTTLLVPIANEGATGTTLNKLAKITGAPSTAIIAATTDTGGIVGIVQSGAGTTGTAQIARFGIAQCVFDGATVAGHYVGISPTVAGACRDAGATIPNTGQVIGYVLSTNVGAGTYSVLVRPEITPAGTRVLYATWANTANNMISTDGGTYNTLASVNGCNGGCVATAVNMGWTIPANLITAGKILRLTWTGLYTSPGSAPTPTFTVKLGATAVYTGYSALANSRTNDQVVLSVLLVGTAAAGASVVVDAVGPQDLLNSGLRNTTAPATVATNASQAITLSVTWGAATAGSMFQARSMLIEELN